jgi:TPR repeat protein
MGYVNAMLRLGKVLAESDPEEAQRWLQMAVSRGSPMGMFNLGCLLQHRDIRLARKLWKEAEAAGYAGGRMALRMTDTRLSQWQRKRTKRKEDKRKL